MNRKEKEERKMKFLNLAILLITVVGVDIAFSSSIDGFEENHERFYHSYKINKSLMLEGFNFDIPLESAIASLESSGKIYRELSLKVNCSNWLPLGGVFVNMKSFQKLSTLGIEQIFVEINDNILKWSKKFDIRINGNILCVPRRLFVKDSGTASEDAYIEFAMGNWIFNIL